MIPVTRTDLSTVLTNRPNTTPMIRGICTFVVFFSVSWPFCRFTLVCEGHFVLCYKEKTEPLDRAMANFCCGASVASEQQHKQDLRRIYRRGNEFSKSSLFTRLLWGFLPDCFAAFYQTALRLFTRMHCAFYQSALRHEQHWVLWWRPFVAWFAIETG